jgi:lipopolysaccharide/colanic/teichoic acid biosynthesis glycosyltransferase
MDGFVERLVEDDQIDKVRTWNSTPIGGGIKRSVDIMIAATALVAIWPLFLMIVIVMKLTDPGPVFFAHERIGFNGRRFRCLKFRSMVLDSEAALQALLRRDPGAAREWKETQKLRRDPRITALGRLLRKTSLDELPQLLNVLAGDMSIVGPRPIVSAEAARYGSSLGVYAAARPGMTGPWQVGGRNDTSYEQRVRLDVEYVENWSLQRDLVVMMKTAYVVLSRSGSY